MQHKKILPNSFAIQNNEERNKFIQSPDQLNLRSEVVQDIIQTEPIWIIRSGIIMWFVMVITIFVALSFIPYHYKVELDIKIKSYQSDDLVLSVKRKEIIYDVIVEHGAEIKAGDTLILLEEYSKISRAKQLRKLLESIISNTLKSTRHYQTGDLRWSRKSGHKIKPKFVSFYGKEKQKASTEV